MATTTTTTGLQAQATSLVDGPISATDELPVYTEYPTQLPADFPIGNKKTSPLVNVTELQAHLRLLGAIKKLENDVRAQFEGVTSANRDLAWVVFVNKAVYRFYMWTSAMWPTLPPGITEAMAPPLDVIMVWHTYLLVSGPVWSG
jgi:hypothetical protein